jgi:hypothetical protein
MIVSKLKYLSKIVGKTHFTYFIEYIYPPPAMYTYTIHRAPLSLSLSLSLLKRKQRKTNSQKFSAK